METKIILSMIVKNESKIINRCLASVLPVIDAAVISDTGSDDDTKKQIHDFFVSHSFLRYLVIDQVFTNYGNNRTLAFQSAKEFILTQNCETQLIRSTLENVLLHSHIFSTEKETIKSLILEFLELKEWFLEKSFALILDADMVLILPLSPLKRHWKEDLQDGDMFFVKQKESSFTLWNPRLLRLSKSWICKGFAHEYWITSPSPDASCKIKQLDSCWISDYNDGGNKKDKFTREIRLLLTQFNLEPKNKRLSYYLGNGYYGIGDLDQAIFWYKKRVKHSSNDLEEQWHAKYMIARIHYEKKTRYEALHSLLEAYNLRPWRIEPLALLIKIYRESKKYFIALLFCRVAQRIEFSAHEFLFVEHDLYQYEILQEISYLAFFVHEKEMGLNACEKLRFNVKIPHSVQRQALQSLHFYADRWEMKEVGDFLVGLRSGKIGHPTFVLVPKTFLISKEVRARDICFETICCLIVPVYTGLPSVRFVISFRSLTLDFIFYESEIENIGGQVREGKVICYQDCLYYLFYPSSKTICYQSKIRFVASKFIFQTPQVIQTDIPTYKNLVPFPWYSGTGILSHLLTLNPPQYFAQNQLVSGKKVLIQAEFSLLAGPLFWENSGWLVVVEDAKDFFRFLLYDEKFQKLEKMTYPFRFEKLSNNDNIEASLHIADSCLVLLICNSKESKISLRCLDLKQVNHALRCFTVESLSNQWQNFYL